MAPGLLPGARELFQHAVKRGDADPGQADKARAGAQPGGGERTRHRAGTFTKKVLDESNRPVTCQARGRLRSATQSRERARYRNRSIGTQKPFPCDLSVKVKYMGRLSHGEVRQRRNDLNGYR